MSQEDEELDKAFRSGIEKMRLVPPPFVWDGVRAAALEQQLFRSQTMNNWLKLLSGVLAVALIGNIYFSSKKTMPIAEKNTVYVTKTDTVFITKTEKILVPIEKEIRENDTIKENYFNEKIEKNNLQNTDNQLVNNKKATENLTEKYDNNSSINNKKSTKDLVLSNNKLVSTDNLKEEISPNETKNTIEISAKNKASKEISKTLNEVQNASVFEKNNAENYARNTNNSVENKSDKLVISNKIEEKFDFGNTISWKPLSEKKLKENASIIDFPAVKYAFRTRPSVRKMKGSSLILSRLSLSTYYSFDANTLRQKENTSYGQTLKLQSLNGYSYGVRVGYELNNKWTLLTGFETTTGSFREMGDGDIDYLKPEVHQNKPTLPHSTPLGTSYIPDNSDGKDKDKVRYNSTGDHTITLQRIPVLAKYTFYDRNTSILGSNYHSLKFYAIGGLDWTFSIKQTLPCEIYNTKDGKKETILLTDFQGVIQNSFGFHVGGGAMYNVWKNWSIFVEPTYKNNFTKIVKEDNKQTNMAGFSILGGINYRLKK